MIISSPHRTGLLATLVAAIFFGASAPVAKLLLIRIDPWMLAGLLYLGSGLGLMLYRLLIGAKRAKLPLQEALWFTGAVVSGGVIAPVLLMLGLNSMPASGVSLLLNAEGVFTALLAWFVFKENFDRRIALGMVMIVLGAVILSWPNQVKFSRILPALAILGACLAWGVDNNLTRKISLSDATWIASVKGLVAGSINLSLAFLLGAAWPRWPYDLGAMLVGFFAYGVSLTLFVVGLRHLGTARTGAYFSVAPFIGAVIAVILGDPITIALLLAGSFMLIGIWLHLTEHHEHAHTHEELEHEHEHVHDAHHQHDHETAAPPNGHHSHKHRHHPISHTHAHFPDIHHRHGH